MFVLTFKVHRVIFKKKKCNLKYEVFIFDIIKLQKKIFVAIADFWENNIIMCLFNLSYSEEWVADHCGCVAFSW